MASPTPSAVQFLESTNILKIEDILPFFPDFVVIDDFKEEICTALEGYSAADCAALVREAALTAMRASLDSTEVTAAQFETARQVVWPSLDPRQLAELEAYANRG